MRPITAFTVLLGASIRVQLRYPANLVAATIGGLAHQSIGLAFIAVMFRDQVIGWELADLGMLYGMKLTAHGLCFLAISQLANNVDNVLRDGEYEVYLVRPVDPLIQLLTRRFSVPVLGSFCGGLAVLATFGPSSQALDQTWKWAYLPAAIVAGAATEASLQIGLGAAAFWFGNTQSARYAVDGSISLFGGFPIGMFPTWLQVLLMSVLPAGLVAYAPAAVLTGHADSWILYIVPFAGIVLLVLALCIWRFAARFYTGTGS